MKVFVYETSSIRNMRKGTVSKHKSEIISAVDALDRSKAVKLFMATPAGSAISTYMEIPATQDVRQGWILLLSPEDVKGLHNSFSQAHSLR